MMMQMIGAFAEFERSMIRERTRAGHEAARRSDEMSKVEVARLFGVSPSTIGRVVGVNDGAGN
ncbi:MAG: DNA invertase Pin-like site-specific DNA recombinase [Verrucomicrobiales bacterium]|jgi:DNA invertase Pin-like site-specific DNA recombinase